MTEPFPGEVSLAMNAVMSIQRVRLVVQVDDDVRDALRLEATLQREDMGDTANKILKAALAESLKQIHERRQAQNKRRQQG